MTKIKHSPWGAPDSTRTLAPGITSISTASHGGIHVDEQRLAAMPAELSAIETFTGRGWYEEDRDWAIVALAWPEAFDAGNVAAAVRTVNAPTVDGFCLGVPTAAAWLLTPAGQRAAAIAAEWDTKHAEHFRISVSGSVPARLEPAAKKLRAEHRQGVMWALMRRIRDGAEAEVLLLEGDSDPFSGPVDLGSIPAERVIRSPA